MVVYGSTAVMQTANIIGCDQPSSTFNKTVRLADIACHVLQLPRPQRFAQQTLILFLRQFDRRPDVRQPNDVISFAQQTIDEPTTDKPAATNYDA